MSTSSKKYVDLIFKASGKYGNWDPPRIIEVGDWGKIDKDTGNFIKEGNIFKDHECGALLSEVPHALLVKTGGQEDVVQITASAQMKLKNDLYIGVEAMGVGVGASWEFTLRDWGAILTATDTYSNYLEVQAVFPRIQKLRKLEGKAVVTTVLHCPAYAMLLTEKGKGGRKSLSIWRTACGYRTNLDGKDAVYTPLYGLETVSKSWRARYRGAAPAAEETVRKDHNTPQEVGNSEAHRTPVEHFQKLFATWKHTAKLEEQSKDNSIGWLIKTNKAVSVDSPEAANFRETSPNLNSANKQGLTVLSEQLECADPESSNPNSKNQGLSSPDRHMAAGEILRQLAYHGCENLTDHIDQNSLSGLPLFSGGFGDIYRGSLCSGLLVAVKTPRVSLNILEENPDYLKDVAREIHTWSKCDHPNVLHFLGLAEFQGKIGMVAPWMKYGSLPGYLKNAYRADRCKLCTQICEGVTYLHEIGIVHGDLKGGNVLISADGVAVISDFGGSLLRNRSLTIIPLEKGTCLTCRWAAPELLQSGAYETDDPDVTTTTRMSQNSVQYALNTKESDIYALGMTILEVISGRLPWYWIKNELAVIKNVCSPEKLHTRPRQIPMHSPGGDKLWRLLNDCWSYRSDARPTAAKVGNVMRTIAPGDLKAYPYPATGNRCALFSCLY